MTTDTRTTTTASLIEHHLFPTCPRHKLRQLTPYGVALCRELDLPYTQVGVMKRYMAAPLQDQR